MFFSDTHFHIENKEDVDKIICEATLADVKLLIVSCCDRNSIETLENIKTKSKMYFSYGFHPYEADTTTSSDIQWLKSKLLSDRVVALGEIGLDYHLGRENEEKQKKLFCEQLDLAEELNLPVVIHSRDATEDTLKILKKYNLKGVIHCFSGSTEIAKEYIKLGYYIGIGGVITFKNSRLQEVVREIGISRILLETDSPYLSPEPYRGRINSPGNIPLIAQKVSEILNIPINDVADITYNNACVLFDLKI